MKTNKFLLLTCLTAIGTSLNASEIFSNGSFDGPVFSQGGRLYETIYANGKEQRVPVDGSGVAQPVGGPSMSFNKQLSVTPYERRGGAKPSPVPVEGIISRLNELQRAVNGLQATVNRILEIEEARQR